MPNFTLPYPDEDVYSNIAYEFVGYIDYDIQKNYTDECCEDGPEQAKIMREDLGAELYGLLVQYGIIEPGN